VTPTQEYVGTMALLVLTGIVMAARRRQMRHAMSAEDLITLTGHLSGVIVAAYIIAHAYADVVAEKTAASLGVATSAAGLIWAMVSLIGAYRLIWVAVAPKDAPPPPPPPPSPSP
jgi:putative exporter of polyketide antibiotics